MKKALSVAAYETGFGPIIYSAKDKKQFSNICGKVKALGFDGMDLFLDKKEAAEISELKKIIDEYGLEVSMVIFIYLSQIGVNFSARDDRERRRFVELYVSEMDKAVTLGALSMPLGFIRGNISSDDNFERYCGRLAESTRTLAAETKQRGIKLCLEPINRYEVNTLLNIPSAVTFLADYGLEDIYLLPDLFHMNIEDAHFDESLRLGGKKIGHMHVADSNRLAPGLGHLDYGEVMQTLHAVGYDGYLSAEAMHGGDPDGAAKQSAGYLAKLISKYSS
jgi:sugar phosphate isomerase/epimerase